MRAYSLASESVELDNVVVRANTATTGAGGGLVGAFQQFSLFVVRNSRVYSNTGFQGGGLYFQGSAGPFGTFSARIENSEIYLNTASHGAGIDNDASPLVVVDSSVRDNQTPFLGGGIENNGSLVISGTTLTANTAGLQGGGIWQDSLAGGAVFTATNSTFSGNVAGRDGGGIYIDAGRAVLLNTTIAGNQVFVPLGTVYTGLGGGVHLTGTATLSLKNTLLGYNTHRYGINLPEPDDCRGTLNSLGYNLVQTTINCALSGTTSGNVTNQDPLLGPLAYNGGATQTRALLSGSPAIDAGEQPLCTDASGAQIAIDQRGYARPFGSFCDIGAFEFYPLQAPVHVAVSAPITGSVGTGYAFTARVSPVTATLALSYTWQATGQSPVTHAGNLTTTDTMSFTWTTAGTQTIVVGASNVAGAVSGTHLIHVEQAERKTYAPLVSR